MLLAIVTVVALDFARQDTSGSTRPVGERTEAETETPPLPEPLAPNPDAPGYEEAVADAQLPPGGEFTERGRGTFSVVPGRGEPFGGPDVFPFTVEIEDGVEVTGGAEGFAADVERILRDPRSWIADGQHGFQRVDDPARARLRITLTSQLTTRELCGWTIQFEGSCFSGRHGNRVVINTARWVRGAVSFDGSLVEYKQYVINHEVGHGLGYKHKPCPEHGALAPVMMQQSWSTSNDYLAALGTDRVVADGKVCRPNAWPYPTGRAR